jgi:hypothetical protein
MRRPHGNEAQVERELARPVAIIRTLPQQFARRETADPAIKIGGRTA